MKDFPENFSLKTVETSALVDMGRSGDILAIQELLRRHSVRAHRTAMSILRNVEDAEDVVQEASLRVFLKIATFEGNSEFSTWFTRIVMNTSFMHLRRAKRQSSVTLDSGAIEDKPLLLFISSKVRTPEQEFRDTESDSLLEAALNGLPQCLRETASDRLLHDLELSTIAARRGLTLTAAKSRLFRARTMLRKKLESSMRRRS